jgi:hypothetical protein
LDIGDIPRYLPLPWADSAGGAYKQTIPKASQIGVVDGRASYTDGFPPLNFVPISVGGVPPFGSDANGLLYDVSNGLRWLQAGGPMPYDATFVSDTGGYPSGAIISSAASPGVLWVSTAENNTTDPDAGGANWVKASIINARLRLLGNITFYVATTGNDANSGLVVGSPFLTIQKAATTIQNVYDLNGFTATVSIAAGTYSAGAQINGAVPGETSPSSIVFTVPSGTATVNGVGFAFAANQGAMFTLSSNGFVLGASLSGGLGSSLIVSGGGKINIAGVLNFGAAATDHVLATTGGLVSYNAVEAVSGGGASHFRAHAGGVIIANSVGVTLTGTPSFSTAYAIADETSVIEAQGYTITSGSATGKRYDASLAGIINTFGGGANVFPGNSAGTATAPGAYA